MCANTANSKSSEKILILSGSPRKNGFTSALVKMFLEEYTASLHNNAEIAHIYLYEEAISPCTGCGSCDGGKPCPLNKDDGYSRILDKIYSADTVILASPVYFCGFPSPVKAMVDRTQQIYAGKKYKGSMANQKIRKGYLLASCGSDDDTCFEPLVPAARQFFSLIDAGFAGKLYAKNTDNPKQIKIFS